MMAYFRSSFSLFCRSFISISDSFALISILRFSRSVYIFFLPFLVSIMIGTYHISKYIPNRLSSVLAVVLRFVVFVSIQKVSGMLTKYTNNPASALSSIFSSVYFQSLLYRKYITARRLI